MPGRWHARGRPLVCFCLLLGSWTLARAALWESPWPAEMIANVAGPVAVPVDAAPLQLPSVIPSTVRLLPRAAAPHGAGSRLNAIAGYPSRPASAPSGLAMFESFAGYSLPPVPASAGEAMARRDAASPYLTAAARHSRLRVDAWLFLREGSRTAASGRVPLYGASQAGAVVAYALAPASSRRPEVYARLSKALIAGGESESAVGLRARPLPALPLAVHAEARLTERAGDIEVRPSAFVTASVGDVALPAAFDLSAYGQAGYVGGRDASAFADGMAVADRTVASVGPASVRAGAGVWGGAQEGTARLDLGPSLSLDVPLAGAAIRLTADYRVRVAGNAAPAGGATLTLSTGF